MHILTRNCVIACMHVDPSELEDIVNGRIVPRSDIQPQTGTHVS